MNSAPLLPRLLSVREAATYLGLSPFTLYAMVSQRRVPYVKVGRLTKFEMGRLNEWITQHSVMPVSSKRS